MKQYHVIPAEEAQILDGSAWDRAETAQIDSYPWDESGYRPETAAQLVYTGTDLWFRFQTVEAQLRIENRGLGPVVCEDSAVELFLLPDPEGCGKYVNLEMNPLCAMYVGVGRGRADNTLLREESLLQFGLRSALSLCEAGFRWQLTGRVPRAFLRRHAGCCELRPGGKMRANFYKIAEKGPLPHFGAWSPIDNPTPDFHRPEFFGELVLD